MELLEGKMMKTSIFEFFVPTKILAGEDSLSNLFYELSLLNSKKPIIVTDKGIVNAGLLKYVEQPLREAGIEYIIFDEVPPDSSLKIVRNIYEICNQSNCDSVIAVGGGSVIDSAKGANILIGYNTENLADLAGADRIDRKLKPLIVIPTTSGTGSEVTSVAVIADEENGVKLSFASQFLIPDVAILDSRMTLSLPPIITAATAMDALTHALEAYLSLQKNPISDSFSLTAIKLIFQNLFKVIDESKNREYRLNMMIASTCAGVAFSNAMVGIVHAIGHTLGGMYKIPHGVAMAILLPAGLEFYYDTRKAEFEEINKLLNIFLEEEVKDLIEYIRNVLTRLHSLTNLPIKLSDVGVRKSDFDKIAKMSLNDGSIVFTPKYAGIDDIIKILEVSY